MSKNSTLEKQYYNTINSSLLLANYYLINNSFKKSKKEFENFIYLIKNFSFDISSENILYALNGYLILNYLENKEKKKLLKIKNEFNNIIPNLQKYIYYNFNKIF